MGIGLGSSVLFAAVAGDYFVTKCKDGHYELDVSLKLACWSLLENYYCNYELTFLCIFQSYMLVIAGQTVIIFMN